MQLFLNLLINGFAVLVADYFLPGVSVNNFLTAIVVGIGLGIVNTFIKPIVLLMTLIHTLNPRFRIDQALIWYVRVPTILAISGLVWAYAFRHFFPAFI